MQKIIALVIVLLGVGGGLALGVALRPGDTARGSDGAAAGAHSAAPAEGNGAAASAGAGHGDEGESGGGHDGDAGAERDYVKLGRQIIIPIVRGGKTEALILFDLALDVPRSMTVRTHAAKPRLRDAFLRELFEMSYTGAFSSTYTDERIIEEIRAKLRAAARRLLGDSVAEVLILDIMRQEL
ncbi:MAG: flagellar basal body-associated FliL family protein [Alphaproteobacteria bacterium]